MKGLPWWSSKELHASNSGGQLGPPLARELEPTYCNLELRPSAAKKKEGGEGVSVERGVLGREWLRGSQSHGRPVICPEHEAKRVCVCVCVCVCGGVVPGHPPHPWCTRWQVSADIVLGKDFYLQLD